ncbi:MAG: hypothetical protein ABI315_05245 [Bacteroidia bacterium]
MKTELIQAIELNAVLNNDFINSETASYVDDKLILNIPHKNELIYHFNDRFILRVAEDTTDTFNLAASQIKVSYIPETSVFINEFSFVAHIVDEKEYFYFCKDYGNANLDNIQSADVNTTRVNL